MNFKYVIIGGSAGGIGAIESIRDIDKAGSIAVISDETTPQYSKPMISEYIGEGAKLEEIIFRPLRFWEEHSVNIFSDKKVAKVDVSAKTVMLENGESMGFEKLLIATGGKPIIPKIDGAERKGVFTFVNLADAQLLLGRLQNVKEVVVVGGGLIGVSLAEALLKLRKKVTIVELKDRILNLILDIEGASMVADAVEHAGVKIITGRSVTRIAGRILSETQVGGVVLDDGTKMSCDIVVLTIGVTPRIEVIDPRKIKVNRGVVVDRFMATSAQDIYACGDVAETFDFVNNDSRLLPLWPLAYVGGRIAGSNMAGDKVGYPGGTQMCSLNYFGIPVISIGVVNPPKDSGYEVLAKLNPESRTYRKIILQNDVIVGMILVGGIVNAGVILDLMKNRVPVGEFKENLLSEEFGLIHLAEPLRLEMLRRN